MDKKSLKQKIKEWGFELGFIAVGFSNAKSIPDQNKFAQWLKKGFHGNMQWLEKHLILRKNPSNILPGVQTVISAAIHYAPNKISHSENPQIASYARHRDYHKVVKKKLHQLYQKIHNTNQHISGRAIADSAPLDEKAWAAQAGIGFIGKNNLLIHETYGSYILLGELLLNVELEPDKPLDKTCENCNQCIKACPAHALSEYELDARKCLSYQTIEHKNGEPMISDITSRRYKWIFGCDTCLQVCPYNEKVHKKDFTQNQMNLLPEKIPENISWEILRSIKTEEQFNAFFAGTPVKRINPHKLQENLRNAFSNS